MATTKPYLIRAIHEWCTDEGLTPYLAVQVDERTQVPREFVRDGQIVLNISTTATHQLLLGNDEISFQTRFNGAAFPVVVPVDAVVAIYARENGQGMAFEVTPAGADRGKVGSGETATAATGEAADSAGQSEPPRRGGHLTRIK
jgi:stringent starvation protein B